MILKLAIGFVVLLYSGYRYLCFIEARKREREMAKVKWLG